MPRHGAAAATRAAAAEYPKITAQTAVVFAARHMSKESPK